MENHILLENILSEVRRLQEFAERKNTYIFSFLTIIVIIVPFINTFSDLHILLKISMCLLLILYIIILILTYIAIMPNLDSKPKNITSSKINKEEGVLTYFGDISKYTDTEYKNILLQKYELKNPLSAYDNDCTAYAELAVFKAS